MPYLVYRDDNPEKRQSFFVRYDDGGEEWIALPYEASCFSSPSAADREAARLGAKTTRFSSREMLGVPNPEYR